MLWEPTHWLCPFDKHANDNVDPFLYLTKG
jgi:hypothetical protein